MTDCKNCKMTDEYCASGDCPTSQSPRNDLATKPQAIDLTEQWRKGELPSGWYWVDYYSVDGAVMLEYIPQYNGFGYDEKNLVQAVLAPVPSYDEYMTMKDCAKKEFEEVEKYTKVKELLKECRQLMLKQIFYRNVPVESDEIYKNRCLKKEELITKIDEVLK